MNILERFERTVRDYPEKTAVADEERSFSFAQLRSAALHNSLKLKGYEDRPIGVMISRGVDTIVNLLSVLYSRNYYVPLDPAMPADKRQSIIEETEMPMILADETTKNMACETGKAFAVTEHGFAESETDFGGFDENRPLYMVYTSGSTGKPKGVLKSHLSMISFMDAYIEKYGFSSEDTIGNQSPFFFDAAAKDLYMMMFSGATMEIIPTRLFSSPYNLIKYLNERKISFISWVPSMLSIIAQVNTFDDIMPEYLNKVFFVGETFPVKQLRKWLKALPNIRYVNLFGSSEVAGVFTTYEIGEIGEDVEFLPIGKAMPNCGVCLVDEGRVVTKPGELGEIWVSGNSVALCYYKDDQKTNERFVISDKVTGRPERCFMTGDIARYDDEGNLVFVTRKDFQIKRMGHRIELGEIEAKANACPLIRKCCCVYNEFNKQLVLFCETANGEATVKDIKNFLKENLSDYMVPSKIKLLESLPLNPNGKIDRKGLKESIM